MKNKNIIKRERENAEVAGKSHAKKKNFVNN